MSDGIDCGVTPVAGLSFGLLRAANVKRCEAANGFNHRMESWSPLEWAGAMAGEAGEACNVAKKIIRLRDGIAGNKPGDLDRAALIGKLAKEVADAVIYADLVLASEGISLGQTVRDVWNEKSAEIGYDGRI